MPPRKPNSKTKQKKLTYTPLKVKKAIRGSNGIKRTIAERLGCSYCHLCRILEVREGKAWDEVRELLETEREQVRDMAEEALIDTIGQRLDLGVASTTARWYLDRQGVQRGYGKKSEVTLQGGDKPIRTQHETLIPIEKLDLPLETKKEVLQAMRKYAESQALETVGAR